jgi:hypothetical protein
MIGVSNDTVTGVLLREYMTLHTPYPLHLTTVRTYTLKLLKGVMTQG